MICSMVVTCPPTANVEIMCQNEGSLKELIARINFDVYDEIFDVYISRKEIDSVTSCTQVYVRLPIYFECQAQNTAATLCTVTVEGRTVSAEVIYTDKRRCTIACQGPGVTPWAVKDNGIPLPEITAAQRQEFNRTLRRAPGYNKQSLDEGVTLSHLPVAHCIDACKNPMEQKEANMLQVLCQEKDK